MRLISNFLLITIMVIGCKYSTNEVEFSNWQMRQPIANQLMSVAYGSIGNHTSETLTLIGVIASPVSSTEIEKVEIHTTKNKQGMLSMVHLPSVQIPAYSTLKFAERGHHLMIYLKSLNKIKNPVELTFIFDDDRHQMTLSLPTFK